eukprot:TRINITY_DN78099_c0_g1_i1.p1 TRINITY_DN78099_c0_g1~~TRINITY_DN78099_c0_g1_i1.p1  ORF type:complete len:135 (-),score=3.51 TRINITY_DN78099_c0_g1_i1:21-425(-)
MAAPPGYLSQPTPASPTGENARQQAHQLTRESRPQRASSFWPYGKGVTCVVGTTNPDIFLHIDDSHTRSCIIHRPHPRRSCSPALDMPTSPTLRRAGSATALLGSAYEITVRAKKERERSEQAERTRRVQFEHG